MFQYPLRVEVGCNSAVDRAAFTEFYVSVPSTGRSGLQRGRTLRRAAPLDVSVPSTGRSGLQPTVIITQRGCGHVSVPSTGRSGLQRAYTRIARRRYAGFSTLYGSKWVATPTYSFDQLTLFCFSTLYGSKWVATVRLSTRTTLACPFQYPLRVEVGCNAGMG